ncbi:hypothetical protein BD310DRAFT_963449 [Dichomitus squalens]|uniref:MARVEL domain-containing protein n=1 Tax=Dichomitus squalens TaxID=114155 RepID=A0A4Q9QEJ1_9APHY|nr:hypothetical protein BD310DRAFT_963449 [Dichomitus squalens]
MVNFSLSSCRYSSFALFTLCNAVLCVIAVWNLTLAQEIGWTPFVDAYLIAIGAAGILWMFPVMFLDQLRKNALVSRVWFECAWVGLFWILNLAGAAAVTAMLPNMMCSFAANLLLPGACATTDVLLAFSWIGMANLLVYLCVLMVSAIIHMKDDSTIWSAHTITYPWFRLREQLNSARPSPVRTTWSKAPLPSAAPSIRLPSDFSDRMVASGTLKSSAMRSSTMKSSVVRSSTFDNEKLSAVPSALRNTKTPLTANKSAKILQSAWISATVTPASPPSDEYSSYSSGSGGSGSDRSDLTSTPTGLPPSAMYVPFSSTIKPSPVPPRSSSLATTFGQPPVSALLTPSRKGSLRSAAAMPSPKPPVSAKPHQASGPRKSKRKSNRPPPLDMTRLHSTYGR